MKVKNIVLIFLIISNIFFIQGIFNLQKKIEASVIKEGIVYNLGEPYVLRKNEYIFNMDESPVDSKYLIGERTYNLPKGEYKILRVKEYLSDSTIDGE